jgi:hypothetical protein
MKKYAKVINEETKTCEVGLGTNSAFYQSIGMVEMEVEEAYNGQWYIKGYTPVKPQELVDEERVAELEKYLNETDWYSIRYAETGKEIPADVLQARQNAREEISKIRGK